MSTLQEAPHAVQFIKSVSSTENAVYAALCVVGFVVRQLDASDLACLATTLQLAEELLTQAHDNITDGARA